MQRNQNLGKFNVNLSADSRRVCCIFPKFLQNPVDLVVALCILIFFKVLMTTIRSSCNVHCMMPLQGLLVDSVFYFLYSD